MGSWFHYRELLTALPSNLEAVVAKRRGEKINLQAVHNPVMKTNTENTLDKIQCTHKPRTWLVQILNNWFSIAFCNITSNMNKDICSKSRTFWEKEEGGYDLSVKSVGMLSEKERERFSCEVCNFSNFSYQVKWNCLLNIVLCVCMCVSARVHVHVFWSIP